MPLQKFLGKLDEKQKCCGITEPSYQEIQHHKTYRFLSSQLFPDGKVVSTSVLRSRSCEGAVDNAGSMCRSCRGTLPYFEKKVAAGSVLKPIHPNTPLSSMSSDVLVEEVKRSREHIKQLQAAVKKLEREVEREGVSISSDVHEGLFAAMEGNAPVVKNSELMKLFWTEQKKAFGRSPQGMRWHPMMLRFAIFMHFQSPRAYEALRETGVLRLPNSSTLRDYTNFFQSHTGFQLHVFEELKKQAQPLPPEKRYVALLHDEMSIKADLVFDRRSGMVIGFTSPDTWTFENDTKANIATHALVFMVVGINSPLKMSIGYFGTRSCTAGEMFPLLWTAIAFLELTCQLKVISSTSDKAGANQKLYRMHRLATEDVVYKARNPYSLEPRFVYFFSDAPHLMKTLRNNLHKSKSGGTRCLWNSGSHLWWSHVYQVYIDDASRELHRTKLTYDHVNLTPASMLRVRLAVQVLSQTVGRVMTNYYGEELKATANFILLCDRFFDCLNVRSMDEHIRTRKSDLAPYRSVHDDRFNFLQVTFLGYFQTWQESIEKRSGFSKADKTKMFLSLQTYEGIVMTVHAFVEATRYLLENGVSHVLSQDFCQDVLEEHFGRHRGLSGRAENPTLHTFGYQENKIRMQRSLAFQFTPKGNTAGKKTSKRSVVITNSPLKKMKHK